MDRDVHQRGDGRAPRIKVDWLVYTIAVDKETWLPVRVREVAAGILRNDYRFRDLRVDDPLPPDAFSPPSSRGLSVTRSDLGFRRVTLDQARDTPGVVALVPGSLPDGYALSSAAIAPSAWTANRVVRARNVFALQYTSGFDALTVSTRTIADEYYTADDDPFDDRADPTWSEAGAQGGHALQGRLRGNDGPDPRGDDDDGAAPVGGQGRGPAHDRRRRHSR